MSQGIPCYCTDKEIYHYGCPTARGYPCINKQRAKEIKKSGDFELPLSLDGWDDITDEIDVKELDIDWGTDDK